MKSSQDASETNRAVVQDTSTNPTGLPTQTSVDVPPPVGITPPQLLAQDAANGKRGAAWRLLYWIMENDPRAVIAVSSLNDDRLAQYLLECLAVGTWAGKPFVLPPPLRSPHARTRLRTLFLPGSGVDTDRAERVALAAMQDKRPGMREGAVHVLGLLGNPAAIPQLTAALDDPVPAIRMQAAKALGRVKDPASVSPLLAALHGADESLGSQIFAALVHLGFFAVPSLIETSSSSSAWLRWHCVRALGEIGDLRAIPVLVQALSDSDHSVAWMAAKGLAHFGKRSVGPVLQLLMREPMTPWLAETSSYVLSNESRNNDKMKPYLDPVVHSLRGLTYKIGSSMAAQKAYTKLIADGVI
jgi:HEAT repeats